MTTLLLLESSYTGMRKYFECTEQEKAISTLKEWVKETENLDIYLTKVGPDGYEKFITNAYTYFTLDLKLRNRGQDYKCLFCSKCYKDVEDYKNKFGLIKHIKYHNKSGVLLYTTIYGKCKKCHRFYVQIGTTSYK